MRVFHVALRSGLAVALAVACSVVASAPDAATGASSSTVVSATITSATQLDDTNCRTGQPGRTDFGTVLPGASIRTTVDCSVGFGSSNDTSMLRLFQTDGVGTAMGRDGFVAQASGTGGITINDISAIGSNTAWLSANSQVVRRTTDGGTTWSAPAGALPAPSANYWDVKAVDSQVVYLVGSDGAGARAALTTDGGASWSSQTSAINAGVNQIYGVDATDAQHVWAVGQAGTVRATADGGATTWATQTPCVGGVDYHDVDVATSTTAWMVGTNTSVCRTTDGGATWTAPAGATGIPAGRQIRGVSAPSSSVVWVTGFGGAVSRSTNGGATWNYTTLGSINFFDVYAVDDRVAWVAGIDSGGANDRRVFRTTDGGTTWTEMAMTPSPTDTFYGIDGIGSTVWVGGSGGALFRSPASSVPDYDDAGGVDWANAAPSTQMFGACLSSVGGGASTGGDTWTASAGCPLTDGAHWRAIPATNGAASKVAKSTTATDTTGVANLRWGFRTADTQPPGLYLATVAFEVVAPNA